MNDINEYYMPQTKFNVYNSYTKYISSSEYKIFLIFCFKNAILVCPGFMTLNTVMHATDHSAIR